MKFDTNHKFKRIILLLFSQILFTYSCSKTEQGFKFEGFYYSVTLETECGNFETQTKYCITEIEYDKILENFEVGNPCVFMEVRDIDGNLQTGYYRAASKSSLPPEICK